MLKKLRLKFVCITMAIVTAMLCVIFGTVLTLTASNLEQQSLAMLYELAADTAGPGRPGEPSGQGRLPYFTLQLTMDGRLVATGGEYFDLTDESFLRAILQQALGTGENSGILREHDLCYYITADLWGQRILFADISSQRQTMEDLTLTCAVIGVVSFGLLLGLSFLLARWAVKPVEKAWSEQRQFVADASHELKTPLTVILTNAELLQTQQAPEQQARFVANIHTMTVQMRGLVEGLLELARVDNGAVKAAFCPVDLSSLVSDGALPFEAVFFEAGLELRTDIQPGIGVKGSAVHLRQVTEILLDNARKYSLPHSCVELRLQRSGSEAVLSLANPGPPIAPEDLKNIFKRFYRADKVRAMDHSYGLGLSIAQSIVAEHGGRIWAQSADGVNTFFVRLPIL